MIVLAGAASFFVGNSYQAQMPAFAHDLGHGDPGAAYSALLGGRRRRRALGGHPARERAAASAHRDRARPCCSPCCWAARSAASRSTRSYPLALALLFAAGFFELSFSSMAQTIVQMNAPAAIRGRVLGLFNMSSAGLRSLQRHHRRPRRQPRSRVHASLALAAGSFMIVALVLRARLRAKESGVV